MGTGDGYPRLGSPGREKDSPKYKHRKAQMGFRSYLWRVYLWEAQIQCNSTIKFACGSPCSNITVPIIICLISNYSAPALEYNPVRHPLFPDKSALQAFPRCTPKLIRKQFSPTPTQPSVIGFSHVFNTRPGPFNALFLPHVSLHM
jgi:hypothetical protein